MIKTNLIFSTGYDSFIYKTEQDLFNKKFVGELQLLSFLERELGLSGEYISNKERQAEYLEYLSKEIEGKNSFISESFNNDNVGVAKELLKWRDELKLCNWDFNKGVSERLDLIADIELNNNLSLGISDRWILILSIINGVDDINIGSIEINDNLQFLHPIYNEIFLLLKDKGVYIKNKNLDVDLSLNNNLSKIKDSIYNNNRKIQLEKNDNSFQILRFKDSIVSADFLAQQLTYNNINPVIINRNNYSLDTSFLTYNIPLSGSEINDSNPQVIQLFKLISALFFKKVNPYNLLSLLSLPMLPFSKKLAKELSKVLISSGGIGNNEWFEVINYFKNNINKEKKNWKEKIKEVDLYIGRSRTEKIKKEDLINVYRNLASWSAKMQNITEEEGMKDQLLNLHILSQSFIQTVENLKEIEFNSRELDKLTNKIYESINIRINNKEKGSYNVIKQPSQLYENVDTLVWFDFYNQELKANFCSFLMQSEINKLTKQKGILLWSKEKQIQLQIINLQKAILRTENKLCLFISEKSNGTLTSLHPLFIQLSSSVDNLKDFIYDFKFENACIANYNWNESQFAIVEKVKLPEETDYIKISNVDLLNKRQTESYSSINDLILNPLDWILYYQAKITSKGLGNIDELITLKGNLSHIIIQTLLQNEKDGVIDFNKVDINNEIDNLLEEFTPKIAAPFYLDENNFEFKSFSTQLKKSFKVLLKIIKDNNLYYDSSEYEAKGKIDSINFSGKIDLLFYKNNMPVIIDLKWTLSSKKYVKILEEEKSIQLALYSKLLNNKNSFTGYFLISDALLYTTNELLEGNRVNIIKLQEDFNNVNHRIINRTVNSYNYRWAEFKNGKLEHSEGKNEEEIQYSIDTETNFLIPLDIKDKTKKPNPYSDYGLFKGLVK
ncbi:PD-(D/E)XK nuclease family protein [Vicingus serpentipes]|uniref:PD-(D/E)XK nuclease family protein n=1 Tax=Vicingus serpentipes TaxID=1926625 RepID=A0A5C6RVN3_9FLAO|nr:PD-(D/E)XK nuclease family protein [Vicingus serpentipes]TXB66157.1 PD-(D/E)XK nuclease family protein [Vicingus serpentipes]